MVTSILISAVIKITASDKRFQISVCGFGLSGFRKEKIELSDK
jgi:hypothetical protein